MGDDSEFTLSFIFGALTIVIFSYGRFNDPPKSRSTTTAFRFHTASAVYALGMFVAYGVLVALQGVGATLDAMNVLSDSVRRSLSDPLVGALLITGLLPQAPGLSAADEWLRGRLKRMAAIPVEVRRLSSELKRSQMELPPEIASRVSGQLRQQGIEGADLLVRSQEGPARPWVVVSGLLLQLGDWRSDPTFSDFLGRNWEEYTALRSRYDQLVPAARNVVAVVADPAADPEGRIVSLAREYRELVGEQIDDLHRRACELIARAVLECGFTQSSRIQQIQRLGFRFNPTSGTFPLDLLVALFLLVSVVYTMIRSASAALSGADVSEALSRALLIASVYVGAVCCAVYPHALWRGTRRHLIGVRPWSLYLVSGLMAAAVAAFLSFGLRFVEHHSIEEAWLEFEKRLPWLIMAFGTAFTLAFQFDNVPSKNMKASRWRAIEAAIQAGVTLACAALVLSLLSAWGTAQGWRVPLVAVVIGSLLGWLVPTWYRGDQRREAAGETATASGTAALSTASSSG